MKYCPDCGKNVPYSPFFCNWCGTCLKKICQKCDFAGFTSFCIECGSKMETIQTNIKQETFSETKVQEIPQVSSSFISEPEFKPYIKSSISTATEEFCPVTDLKVKVHILQGDDMKPIKLENGGGRRSIIMKKTDRLTDVKRKLTEKYFPRNKYSSLGSFKDYSITFLDFKKDDLLSSGYFSTVERYLNDNGLRVNQGPAFYLFLRKISNSNSLQSYSKPYCSSTSTMFTSMTPKTDILIASFQDSRYQCYQPKAIQTNNTKEEEKTQVKRPISMPSIETVSKKIKTSPSSINSEIVKTDNKKSAPVQLSSSSESDSSDSSDSETENSNVKKSSKTVVKSKEIKNSNVDVSTLKAKQSLNKVKSDEVNSVLTLSPIKTKVKKTLLPNPASCIEMPSRLNSDDIKSFSNENNADNNSYYNRNSRHSDNYREEYYQNNQNSYNQNNYQNKSSYYNNNYSYSSNCNYEGSYRRNQYNGQRY